MTPFSTILKGVPTNAQFTLSLLRLSELSGQPLPPPPRIPTPSPTPVPSPPLTSTPLVATGGESKPRSERSLKRNDSQTSLIDYQEIVSYPSTSSSTTTNNSNTYRRVSTSSSIGGGENKSVKSRFAAFVRSAAKVGEESAAYASGHKPVNWEKVSRIAVDKVKAVTGSNLPEHFMTVVPTKPINMDDGSSSSIFYAHLGGRPGHLLLLPPTPTERESSPSWYLEFVPVGTSSTPKSTSATSSLLRPRSSSIISTAIPPSPIIQISTRIKIRLSSIISLKKTAGIGWKSRLTLGLIMGTGNEFEGDGIELKWKEFEKSFSGLPGAVGQPIELTKKFSAIVRRDELFNRLASLDGNSNWELA